MANTPNYDFEDITRQTANVFGVTNDNWRIVEVVTGGVISRTNGGPPGGPSNGDQYIVDVASGAWAGFAVDDLAQFENAVWTNYVPKIGFHKSWVIDDNEQVVFLATGWENSAVTSLGLTADKKGSVLFAVGDGTLGQEPTDFLFTDATKTLKLSASVTGDRLLLASDKTGSAATDSYDGMKVLATQGTAEAYGVTTGVGVNAISQSAGTFGNPTFGEVETVDTLTEFTTADSGGSNDVDLFVADTDEVLVGDTSVFDHIEYDLFTVSSEDVGSTFFYSTGSSSYTQFFPSDGTIGFQRSGVVSWRLSDLTSWSDHSGTFFKIRIVRNNSNTITTLPKESTIQISAATEHTWDKDGNLVINDLTVNGTFSLPAATETVVGGVELATDAEAVTGTDTTNKAIIPSSLTAKMSAPGPIGDTTAAAINATTIATTGTITTSAKVTTGEFVANVPDNNALAVAILEGANLIFGAGTLNGSESVVFGNVVTNPAYFFLGSGASTFSGPIHGPNGGTAAPTFAPASDTHTGIHFPVNDHITLAVGGVDKITLNPTIFESLNPFLGPQGSESAPGHTFTGKTNTGLTILGGNDFGFTSNGGIAMVIDQGQKIAIGSLGPGARLDVTQPVTDAAIPVLDLEQLDIDDSFINFIGTSASDGTRSISSDTTEDSAKSGALLIEVNGTPVWFRFYATES